MWILTKRIQARFYDLWSQIPAVRIITGPVTAKIEIIDNCVFGFKQI